jgi:hypothetical protein
MVIWPDWWSWEIELSLHILKRMADRRFDEVELRAMLEDATAYHLSLEPGRWRVATRHAGRAWEVVVEPLEAERVLLIVTAYPIEP